MAWDAYAVSQGGGLRGLRADHREDARKLSDADLRLLPDVESHLVLWPERDGDLGAFMQKLTITHVRNWQENQRRVGCGQPRSTAESLTAEGPGFLWRDKLL